MKIINGSKIYFIGIGGKGLNGIVNICIKKGCKVYGSDIKESEETKKLEKSGAKIFYKQIPENITKDIDLVVRTSVVNEKHPEVLKALEYGIPVIKRSEFLGQLIKDYKNISVAGSHGKSTTTALIGLALKYSDYDPTIFGGALIKELDAYNLLGKGKYSVTEACEYDRSFHDLVSDYAVINSLEKSHMEYYKDEKEMNDSFKDFLVRHDKNSKIFINGDNFTLRKISSGIKAKVITYGFNASNDYVIKNFQLEKDASCFDLYKSEEKIVDRLKINIPGDYNIINFVSVLVLFNELGFNKEGVYEVARNFTGVGRRFEINNNNKNLIFVDDFCHHPTQVSNLFKGVKQFFPDKKVLAIFEPRQFNLIKTFIKEYGKAFKGVDEVFITDIVPALLDTEKDMESLDILDIKNSIKNNSGIKNVSYVKDYEDIVQKLKNKKDYVVTTIGAGSIYKVRDMFLKYV
jgi:UDP-N-acetylmuramate--alanine ligase